MQEQTLAQHNWQTKQLDFYPVYRCSSSVWWKKAEITQLGIDDVYLFPPVMFTDILKCDPTDVLDVDYPDLYHYVVLNPLLYISWELKAYKSLSAHK